MSSFEINMLETIMANDGKFSWYQLDRALTQRGVDPGIVSSDLMRALRDLEQAGFIYANAGSNRSQPAYSITPAGRQQLDSLRPKQRYQSADLSEVSIADNKEFRKPG